MKITVNDVALDSPEQALFWGLMMLLEIPVERTTELWPEGRSDGKYQWRPGFYLTNAALWVEVEARGGGDPSRYAAWRQAGRNLAVVRREELDVLRVMAQGTQATAYLEDLAVKALR